MQGQGRQQGDEPSTTLPPAVVLSPESAKPGPGDVLMGDVRWPLRLRVLGVEGVRRVIQRADIVHGEEVVTDEPLEAVQELVVQVKVLYAGSTAPGCDMETRPVSFGSGSTRWCPAEWMSTSLHLRDLPADSRIVFVLGGLWPEAVEPQRMAVVCVPLTDYLRRVVSGHVQLRMWSNVIDAEHSPPVENTVDAVPPATLHVEFDAFLHRVVAPLATVMAGMGTLGDSGAATEPELPLTKRGWMHKLGKGGRLTSWRRRWFVLNETAGTLSYYVSNLADDAKGVIELDGMTIAENDELNSSYQRIVGSTRKTLTTYCFKLTKDRSRTYHMYTESKQERRDWLDAIAAVINSSLRAKAAAAAAAATALEGAASKPKKKKGVFGFLSRKSSSSKSSRNVAKVVDVGSPRGSAAAAAMADQRDLSDAGHWVENVAHMISSDFGALPGTGAGAANSRMLPEVEAQLTAAANDADRHALAMKRRAQAGQAAEAAAAEAEAADEAGTEEEEEEGEGDEDAAAAAAASGDAAGAGVDENALATSSDLAVAAGDPALLYGFVLALAREMCEENLLFWLAATRWARESRCGALRGAARTRAAVRLYRKFVSATASLGPHDDSAVDAKKSASSATGGERGGAGAGSGAGSVFERAKAISVGGGLDETYEVGISAAARKSLTKAITEAVTAVAKGLVPSPRAVTEGQPQATDAELPPSLFDSAQRQVRCGAYVVMVMMNVRPHACGGVASCLGCTDWEVAGRPHAKLCEH